MGNTTIKVTERQLEYAGFDGGGIAMYNYKGKPFTGFMIEYFPDALGVIASEIEYKNGYEDGFKREFYKNGKLESEYHTKNNMLDGVCKEWDKEGNLISEKIWEKGKLIKKVK